MWRATIRQDLAAADTPAKLVALRQHLRAVNADELFDGLFPLLLDSLYDGVDQRAAALLVALDPPCPLPCRAVLERLAQCDWNPSLEEIVFYLILQFGKQQLVRVAKELAPDVGEMEQRRLGAVIYWCQFPSIDLAAGFLRGRPEVFRC